MIYFWYNEFQGGGLFNEVFSRQTNILKSSNQYVFSMHQSFDIDILIKLLTNSNLFFDESKNIHHECYVNGLIAVKIYHAVYKMFS